MTSNREGKEFEHYNSQAALFGQSVVEIATRTAQAIRALIDAGKVRAEEFPLLLHVDELINQGKKVNIPWKAFETELEL